MATILDYYLYSQLANAVYLKLDDLESSDGFILIRDIVTIANNSGRIPNALANLLFDPRSEEFINSGVTVGEAWKIPVSGYQGNDSTGFAATLFQRINDGSTEKVLAIRGTEPEGSQLYLDLLKADLAQIGFIGLALEQTISMVNYIERLKADVGTFVRQLSIKTSQFAPQNSGYIEIPNTGGDSVYVYFETDYEDGLGLINEGDAIIVTGHSLGGHLAGIAARLYPRLIDDAYLYNAPGVNPEYSDEILGSVQNLISAFSTILGVVVDLVSPAELKMADEFITLIDNYLGLFSADNFSDVTIHSLETESIAAGDDISIVSSFITNQEAFGVTKDVPVEGNSHLIEPFMDSLALQALLYKLDNKQTFYSIGGLYQIAANFDAGSEEEILSSLHTLFVNNPTELENLKIIDIEDGVNGSGLDVGFLDKGSISDRQDYFTILLSVEDAIRNNTRLQASLGSLSLNRLVKHNSDGSESLDINGKPKLLTSDEIQSLAQNQGSDGIAYRYALKNLLPFVLINADAIYQQHNQNYELDVYDPVTGLGQMTQSYINDRAEMLKELLEINVNDGYQNSDGSITNLDARKALVANGPHNGTYDRLVDMAAGYDLDFNKNRIPHRDVIFGSDKGEKLDGGNSASGEGDRLYGMGGGDQLIDSRGDDYLEGGTGDDTYIIKAGTDAVFDYAGSDTYNITGEGNITITDLESDGTDHYVINNFKGSLTINDTDAEFDLITINGQRVNTFYFAVEGVANTWESVTADENKITVTLNSSLTIDDGSGSSIILDSYMEGDFGIQLTELSTFEAAETNILITTPNPGISPGGFYTVYSGYDFITPGSGTSEQNEHIIGSEGRDQIDGFGGDDTLEGLDGNDVIGGGSGNDLIDGGSGNDFLSGEGGSDHILGGGGDDDIAANFVIQGLIGSESDDDVLLEGGTGNDTLLGSNGDDQIYANSRDDFQAALNSDSTPYSNESDFLTGGAGDDLLVGSQGNDYLGGAAGNDLLIGGAGDDIITGDKDWRTLYQNSWSIDEVDGVLTPNSAITTFADREGMGNDIIYAGGGNDTVDAGAGNDNLYGNAGDDKLFAREGADYLDGGAGADSLHGGLGDDTYFISDQLDTIVENVNEGDDAVISTVDFTLANDQFVETLTAGGTGDIRLTGNDQNNDLEGNGGANTLTGGKGSDRLYGGDGDDNYIYNVGDGDDEITDSAGIDTLTIQGIDFSQAVVNRSGSDLSVQVKSGSITIRNWYEGAGSKIENIKIGSLIYSAIELEGQVNAPRNSIPIASQAITEDEVYSYTIPAGTFTDPNGDAFTLSAALANGNPLPSGLVFDEATQTISGTPDNAGVGDNEIRITATDSNGLVGSYVFTMVIENVNDAPVFASSLTDQVAVEDHLFSYVITDEVLFDPDLGDMINISATLSNGDPLPGWLSFDPISRTFSGIPSSSDMQTFDVLVSAVDLAGESISDVFTVRPNYKPVISSPANLVVNEDTDVGITISVSDPDATTSFLRVSLTASHGQINLENTTGLTFVSGDGVDDSAVSFIGSELEINQVLSNITYRGNPDYAGGLVRVNILQADTIDLSELDSADGFRFTDYGGSNVSDVGDVNGDGIDDLIFGSSSSSPNGIYYSGAVRVLYGRSDGFGSEVNLETIASNEGYTFLGDTEYGRLGSSVSGAGDINGDGYNDLLFSAPFRDSLPGFPASTNVGEAYVVFGQRNIMPRTPAQLDGATGFNILWNQYSGSVGHGLSDIGDINGDGYDDIIVQSQGGVSVIYGKASGDFASTLDLSRLSRRDGFSIIAPDTGGALKVSGAGDVNGDGLDDFLVAHPLTSNASDQHAGRTYVIYGQSKGFGSSLDLATLSLGGTSGFRIDGISIYDGSGSAISSAGDVNGDGIDDILIGAPYVDPDPAIPDDGIPNSTNQPGSTGQSYVVFGEAAPRSVLNLSALNGANGFAISGLEVGGYLGYKVSDAGDFNADGYDDILVSLSGSSARDFGESYLLFGKPSGFAAEISVADISGAEGIRFFNGSAAPGRRSASNVSAAGDINNDGYDDIVLLDDYHGGYIVYGRSTYVNQWSTDDDLLTIDVTEVGQQSVASSSQSISIDIVNVNDAPKLINPTQDAAVIVGDSVYYSFSETFLNVDIGDEISVEVRLSDGAALPNWLAYSNEGNILSGNPTSTDVGSYDIAVTAFDAYGLRTTDEFNLYALSSEPLRLSGGKLDDVLRGGIAADTISGGGGNDYLLGEAGDDLLKGGNGNDTLYGGVGNDTLNGGRHDDTYLFGYGDDQDVITDSNGSDQLIFGEGVGIHDIWLYQAGNDLQAYLLDSDDHITIDNWFKGKTGGNQVEQFQTDGGSVLLNNQVDQLIQAMAVFDPPASGQFTPSQALRDELGGTIAAVWQAA